uniref:SWIM-type domain-containing protein n=1 Tax=Lactuca sativa TaxID=4236 RepID=A0A9R1UX56_LACSA|nr:hypothetical protein LSAT_V11C700347290 [Lactuca sativa]
MLTETTHDHIQRIFVKRGFMGGGCKSPFDSKQQRSRLRFRPTFSTTCVMNLNCHTCSHGKWRSLGIACGHVIATSRYSNITKLADMVQIYYHADVFRTTYQTKMCTLFPLQLNGKYLTRSYSFYCL